MQSWQEVLMRLGSVTRLIGDDEISSLVGRLVSLLLEQSLDFVPFATVGGFWGKKYCSLTGGVVSFLSALSKEKRLLDRKWRGACSFSRCRPAADLLMDAASLIVCLPVCLPILLKILLPIIRVF